MARSLPVPDPRGGIAQAARVRRAQARQQLLQLAQRIGMTEAEALEAEARHQRRRS
jgi:hypothetical protein